jgi:PKD repeat protein
MVKSLFSFFTAFMLFSGITYAQTTVFWTEDFNNGCTQNCNVAAFTSANGAWTVSLSGTNGSHANEWFVSCAENGEAVGSCGAGCGNNSTLHVGSVPCTLCFVCPNGDCGASYNAGPSFGGQNPATDKRAESPVINTTGKTSITLSFKYMENGQGTTDDATIEYSLDSGLTWLLLVNPAKTNLCGSGQGTWTTYNYALPATCENITTLKIAFRWKNNANAGTDPSFAADDVELSAVAANLPVAIFAASDSVLCEKSCISYTDLSTNAPTAWAWSLPGGQPDTSIVQNPANVCYLNYGTYPVTLTVTNAGGSGATTYTSFITVHPEPAQPTITQSNDTLICSPAYSYQWYLGITPIVGATSQTYLPLIPGQYFCLISDSNDCSSGSNVIVTTSILQIDGITEFQIFYDAVQSTVILSADKVDGKFNASLSIIDVAGRAVSMEEFIFQSSFRKSFSLTKYESGVYIIVVNINGKRFEKKIVK